MVKSTNQDHHLQWTISEVRSWPCFGHGFCVHHHSTPWDWDSTDKLVLIQALGHAEYFSFPTTLSGWTVWYCILGLYHSFPHAFAWLNARSLSFTLATTSVVTCFRTTEPKSEFSVHSVFSSDAPHLANHSTSHIRWHCPAMHLFPSLDLSCKTSYSCLFWSLLHPQCLVLSLTRNNWVINIC